MTANSRPRSPTISVVFQGKPNRNDDEETSASYPSMFSIPTHVTTPARSDEYLEANFGDSLSELKLEGRPLPSPVPVDDYDSYPTSAANQFYSSDQQPCQVPASLQMPRSTNAADHISAASPTGGPSKASVRQTQYHVEKTPFPSLVEDTSNLPPEYDSNQYSNSGSRTHIRGTENPRPPPPTMAGQSGGGGGGGRFPRWRGWLEKRALERHFERLDAAGSTSESDVRRKKSWGAGVHDDDALSEGDDQDENEEPAPIREPMFLHTFGSRFISHLSSLPLCSAYLDISPPSQPSRAGQRLLRRTVPEGAKRHVLLIGTADGLYVAECRKRRKQDDGSRRDSFKWKNKAEGKRKEDENAGWNDNIRCRQVWSGVGVYQMSILTSKANQSESRGWRYGFPLHTPPPQDTGILLALCSTVKNSAKLQALYLNAPANSASFNTVNSAGVSSQKENGTPYMATSHFGVGGGGGPGKVVPPNGTGVVRMWSLEALQRVVAHTLDASEPKVLNLLQSRSRSSSSADGKIKLTAKLRKAWASLGDPPSERKAKRASRQSASLGFGNDRATPNNNLNEFRSKMSADSEAMQPLSHHQHQRSESRISSTSETMDEFGKVQHAPDEVEDDEYRESLRLAQNFVAISVPGGTNTTSQQVNLGQSDSLTSLFSEESIGAGAASNSGHGSLSAGQSSGKGVLFFTVYETVGSEIGGTGTWYMALATSKSIYLYEAARPTNAGESARSWVFVKEFYTPFSPKSISFVYSEASESDEGNHHHHHHHSQTRKQDKNQGSLQGTSLQQHQTQVKSSPYSSVFRSHTDLTLLVSFGRKAVLIRANDASVKEADLFSFENDLHVSAASEAGHSKLVQHHHPHNSSHKRRSISADLLTGDLGAAVKEQWIGLEKVVSQVIIRCKHQNNLDPTVMNRSCSDQATPKPKVTSRFGDGEDDDDDDSDERHDGRGVTLQDIPPLPLRASTQNSVLVKEENNRSVASEEPAHVIDAKIALLSKGAISQIYPLPLPWDFSLQRPLGSFQWSGVPTAVTAWSRVIGLERDFSSGPISINSLGSMKKRKAETANMLLLHVSVTGLAFLPSRVEVKRIQVKVQVKVPFVFNRDSELVLESIGKQEDSTNREGVEYEGGEEVTEGRNSHHQELEYLCGMLSVAPKGQDMMKPWEANGGGGAWAFDWRGANDFRLFFVGAQV